MLSKKWSKMNFLTTRLSGGITSAPILAVIRPDGGFPDVKGGPAPIYDEMSAQPDTLARFAAAKVPEAPRGSILAGAGDSYAAALAGQYASDGTCLAVDPYALATNPKMAEGRDVFFISVSGKTSSNVRAAQEVRKLARHTTAVTAVPGSPLAELADGVVALPMKYAPKTPGILSFCLSLLAVMKITGQDCQGDFVESYNRAKGVTTVSFAKGVTYFLGNHLAFPVAIYAAAKTYEFLGSVAQGEQLEEFSHMQLFSMTRSDVVNAFSAFDPYAISKKLSAAVKDQRYVSNLIPDRGSTLAERLFYSVFVVQLSVLKEARLRGLSEPKFLTDKGRLAISDSMIY